jgi:NAD(P)-dependent dehydrogenase (short-subunit alcohol dehydrogenase family)
MLSATAFMDPPAPADLGGWGFAYPSSKAAFGRMAGALRAEHGDSGLRVFNLEPGTVITEVMKQSGIDKEILKRFKPCSPAAIGAVVAWLAENEPKDEWHPQDILRGPAIAKTLGLLDTPSALAAGTQEKD